MKLQSRVKIAHDRCIDPAETIARLESLIAPHHDFWMHEETVAEHLHWSAMFIDGLDFRSMGKGITPAFSKAGALAEGAEWLAARAIDELPGYTGSRQCDLSEPLLPIEDLLRHVATATPPVLERIHALDEAWHWVDAYSLCQERMLKVPIEYIRLISGPNGKATGNSLEEAILHGVLEVFERRAHITVLRNRMVMPTIDPGTITHPVIREQMAFIRRKGIEITIKDLSFGGVLPCIGVYFRDPSIPADYQFHHFFKVGAAFDREEALMRTFTEFAQGRRQHEFLDVCAPDYPERLAQLLDHDFRRIRTTGQDYDNFLSSFMFGFVPYRCANFLEQGEIIPFDRGISYRDCLDDIAQARRVCETLGKDFLVIDLTDPAFGFPVAQVVIPGYSDVLPYHPANSHGLFRQWTRSEVLASYAKSLPSS